MSERFVFLSEGKISIFQGGKTSVINSSIVDGYKKRLKEISAKNEWKNTGSGAKFMGMNMFNMAELGLENDKLYINAVARYGKDTIAYSFNSVNVGGIYSKNLSNEEVPETYVLVKEKIRFYDIDVNIASNKIVSSVSETYLERHVAMVDADRKDFSILTEGECYDGNPTWSRKDKNIIYYDSCGLGFDSNQNFIRFGPKSVFRLNIESGNLEEVLENDKFDFYKPYEDSNGNLYYIKRPYNYGKTQKMTLKDVLLIPIKLIKAIFGWLNFFTQRYAGESLKTNGSNPAKTRQQTPEELFIDGNLLEVEKNLKQNQALGEKNPGYAPSNWELVVKNPSGEEITLKKGVMDYRILDDNSILYSNGKYIIKRHETGIEEVAAKAHLAFKIVGDL